MTQIPERDEKGYNGNPLLKKTSKNIEWTPELIDEYVKCRDDPIYFAEKYIKIVHVDHGLIPIELYDYQKEIIEKITNGRRVTVVASRQCGKCQNIDTLVKLRNKNTGLVCEMTLGELYARQSKIQDQKENSTL